MNAHPSGSSIERYEKKNGQITMGQMSTYLNRYSFFTLWARRIKDIDGNRSDDNFQQIVSKIFAIKGRQPTAQYNEIRITHPQAKPSQYEFQFRPYPGNAMYKRLSLIHI